MKVSCNARRSLDLIISNTKTLNPKRNLGPKTGWNEKWDYYWRSMGHRIGFDQQKKLWRNWRVRESEANRKKGPRIPEFANAFETGRTEEDDTRSLNRPVLRWSRPGTRDNDLFLHQCRNRFFIHHWLGTVVHSEHNILGRLDLQPFILLENYPYCNFDTFLRT